MVSLSIDHPADSSLEVPDPGHDKDIVLRGREFTEQELNKQTLRSTYTYDLTSFRPGRHRVSEAEVTLTLADNTAIKAPFPHCEIEVLSALNEGQAAWQGLRDIRHWPPSRKGLIITLLILVTLFVLIVGGIICLVLYLRKKVKNKPAPPPIPAHIIALNELKILESDQLIEKHEIEPFFVRLSGIMRFYLQNRFDIHAPEQTTEEFIRSTYEEKLLKEEHSALLGHFLEQSDLVKFARFQPDEDVMHAALSSGKAFVEESCATTPEEHS